MTKKENSKIDSPLINITKWNNLQIIMTPRRESENENVVVRIKEIEESFNCIECKELVYPFKVC